MRVATLSGTFLEVESFLGKGGVRGYWVLVLGNRLTAALTLATAIQIAIGSALEAKSMEEICLGATFVLGYPTTFVAQLMFGRHLSEIRRDLRALAAVSQWLECSCRTNLARTARIVRLTIMLWVAFSFAVMLSVSLPSFAGVLHVRVWPQLSGWAYAMYCIPYNIAISAVVCGMYGLLLMTQGVGLACEGLMEEIGARVEASRGPAELMEVVRAHQGLVRTIWRMRDRQKFPLAPGVLNMTLLPLLSAFSYLAGSSITLLQATLIVTSMSALYLVCASTDRMTTTAESVATRTYSREWLGCGRSERILMVILINVSHNRPLEFVAEGFGPFNTAQYMNVMKTWYTYLQMLLGISSKATAV